jgi:hypothetical protein
MQTETVPKPMNIICSTLNNPIGMFVITVIIIATIQWCSIQFLANYCAMNGFMGLIYNFMNLGSPMCMFVNTIQYHLSVYYITIWTSAAASILTYYKLSK